MVENTLVKEQLTSEMIDAGEELTLKLDELGLPITVALWLFDTEMNEWRLFFASPDMETRGPLALYEQIDSAIPQVGSKSSFVPLSVIGLLDSYADLVRALRSTMKTGISTRRVRVSRKAIKGEFIEDALVYRAA